MSRAETTEEWILEDLAAITGKDIKELRKCKSKTKSTPVNRHKYFRRPGKRHNNDFCFSCREGGTLICCDGCTKSFHLLCLDPPMEDEDIPEGEWLCKTCKLGKDSSEDVVCLQSFTRKRKRFIDDDDSEDSKEAKVVRLVWSQLIRRALESDPKEYENPLDCRTIPYIFPGDSKNSKKSQMKPKMPHSLQCYICGKGVSKQSMINCDYCERSFHLDCTDPPLTVPPKYFWMCQFHIEPCLESLFYQEEIPSLSQRMALWDMCRKPIDHEVVKLEFLRNTVVDASDIVQLPTVAVDIPDAVYNHYIDRPDLIPSLKEALRLVGYNQSIEYLKQAPSLNQKHILDPMNGTTSKEEQELWLTTIVGFQRDMISKLKDGSVKGFYENKKDKILSLIKEKESEIDDNKVVQREENSNSSDNVSNASKSTSSSDKVKVKKPHNDITKVVQAAIAELPEADECLNIMNYLDDDFVNVLAFQRLCQLLNNNKVRDKILQQRNLHSGRNFQSLIDETKNLTNPQLELFVGTELKNATEEENKTTISQDALDTIQGEAIILNVGESFKRISKETLKNHVDKDSDEEVEEIKLGIDKTVESSVISVEKVDDVESSAAVEIKEELNEKTRMEVEETSSDINTAHIERINSAEISVENTEIKSEKIDSEEDSSKGAEVNKIHKDFFLGNCSEEKIVGVLTTVNKKMELFPIYKSGFVIGRGSGVHLDLSKCGHCNFVSNHHAVIYFDSRTHLWELINYSRYGCKVDNIMLSFDVSKRALQNILDEDSDDEFCSFHESIKSITKEQSALLDVKIVKKERDEIVKKFFENPCGCDPKQMHSNMSTNGWNNSVPFGHGSLLQFGCIGLVFGDTSCVSS